MLGEYQELNDELYMISSVRALENKQPAQDGQEAQAQRARQNQLYNLDDIDELKNLQILGETHEGKLTILPQSKGFVAKATPKQLNLARILVTEENYDREIIWKHTIATNENLSKKDLLKVKKTYAKQIYQKSKSGHWYKNDSGVWTQKSQTQQDSKPGTDEEPK